MLGFSGLRGKSGQGPQVSTRSAIGRRTRVLEEGTGGVARDIFAEPECSLRARKHLSRHGRPS